MDIACKANVRKRVYYTRNKAKVSKGLTSKALESSAESFYKTIIFFRNKKRYNEKEKKNNPKTRTGISPMLNT